MGAFVIYLAGAEKMTAGPGFQAAIGRWLSRQFEQVQRWLSPVPEPVLGLLVLAVAGVFVWATVIDRRSGRPHGSTPSVNAADDHRQVPCHHAPTPESVGVQSSQDEEKPR